MIPVVVSYLSSVLTPASGSGEEPTVRNSRELSSLAALLDCLAAGQVGEAADISDAKIPMCGDNTSGRQLDPGEALRYHKRKQCELSPSARAGSGHIIREGRKPIGEFACRRVPEPGRIGVRRDRWMGRPPVPAAIPAEALEPEPSAFSTGLTSAGACVPDSSS